MEDVNVPKSLIILVVLGILALIGLGSSCTIVSPGHEGVVIRVGDVQDQTLDEGMHFVWPFISTVEEYDVRTTRMDVRGLESGTRDLQEVGASVTVNYKVMPGQVARLHQEVGTGFQATILEKAAVEAVKATTAQYAAEELITKRSEVRRKMEEFFLEKVESMQPETFIIVEFSISDFRFSRVFTEAVEAKQAEAQAALTARNRVLRAEAEADTIRAQAQGEADAIRARAAALREDPMILLLNAIEKWDGRTPLVVGDAGMILDLQPMLEMRAAEEAQEEGGE